MDDKRNDRSTKHAKELVLRLESLITNAYLPQLGHQSAELLRILRNKKARLDASQRGWILWLAFHLGGHETIPVPARFKDTIQQEEEKKGANKKERRREKKE